MKIERLTIATGLAVLATTAAEAHTGVGATTGFNAGFLHPLTGIDHLVAMTAVGLWAGLRGDRAVWLWPATFVAALALGGACGMAGLPLPFAEQGIQGVNVTSWYGLLAPAGTPPEVAAQLAKDAAAILGDASAKDRLKAQGMTESTMTPAAFDAYIRNETAVWAKVITSRHIVAE